MSQIRKFILFELNEVPERVLRGYAERRPKSNVAELLRRSRYWDTVCEDKGHLSPWVTWPTVHRGVNDGKHQIRALGQDVSHAAKYPPVWQILAENGLSVGLFGSLHSYPLPSDLSGYAFYVPDTFAGGPETLPSELSQFQQFNLNMVDRSGRNVSRSLPVAAALRFFRAAPKLGLRIGTLSKIVRQVLSERVKPYRAARRRTIQSVLSFDLFLRQMKEKTPDAAFFFTNHVASAMHRYWPATFRKDYRVVDWKEEWVKRFAGEIDHAMDEADEMVGELIAFVRERPEYLILATGSMGQAAVDDPSSRMLREVLLDDGAKLVGAFGIEGSWERRRTMHPDYSFAFAAEADADRFSEGISKLQIAGHRIEPSRPDTHMVAFLLGQKNIGDADFTISLGNESVAPQKLGIVNQHIDEEVGSAAYHVPEGFLTIYDPLSDEMGRISREPISTIRIAPTLLAISGVQRPPYMSAALRGIAATSSVQAA